jgi:hypothetical protein
VVASGKLDTYDYPEQPYATNMTSLGPQVLDSTLISVLGSIAGATQTSGTALVILEVDDCAGNPIKGATVSSSPAAGAIRYMAAGVPNSTATATDVDGRAFLFSVPVGQVDISGAAGGVNLRTHTLDARADVLTLSILKP